MTDAGNAEATPSGDDAGAIRIGTEERESAITALDTHLSAGRIDAEEYGDRSAKVYAARSWSDLTPLFVDLPEPRPTPPSVAPRSPSTLVPERLHDDPPRSDRAAVRADRRDRGHDNRGPAALIFALSPFIATILFFLTGAWPWFLLVPIAGVVSAYLRDRS